MDGGGANLRWRYCTCTDVTTKPDTNRGAAIVPVRFESVTSCVLVRSGMAYTSARCIPRAMGHGRLVRCNGPARGA